MGAALLLVACDALYFTRRTTFIECNPTYTGVSRQQRHWLAALHVL